MPGPPAPGSAPALPRGSRADEWPPEGLDDRLTVLQQRMAAAGYPVRLVSKKRTAAEQKELYAKGRTKPGAKVTELSGDPGQESRHQLGEAADFAFTTKGRENWDLLGAEAKKLGLEWGGDWTSLKDRPHVQLPKHTPFPRGAQAPGGFTDPKSVKVTSPSVKVTSPAVGAPPPAATPVVATSQPMEEPVVMPTPPPGPAPQMAEALPALAVPDLSPAPATSAVASATPVAPVPSLAPAPTPVAATSPVEPATPAAPAPIQAASATGPAPAIASADFVDEPLQAPAEPGTARVTGTSPGAVVDFVDEPLTIAPSSPIVSTASTGALPESRPGLPSPSPSVPSPSAAPAASSPFGLEGLKAAASQVYGPALSFIGMDPRSPEGRRNLAGAGGAIAATALAPETGGLSIVLPAAGAFLGGAAAETGEQLVGSHPPTLQEVAEGTAKPEGFNPTGAALAGGEQLAYELGGRALLWPIRAVGRRIIGSRVARYASETISQQKQALATQLQIGLDAAKDLLTQTKRRTRQTVSSVAEGVRGMVRGAEETTARNVGVAGQQAAARTAGAEAAAQAGTAAASRPYERLVGQPPPSAAQAGRTAAHSITEGSSAAGRDLLGQAVDEAADSGPEVNIQALKAEARRILENEIKPPAQTFPAKARGTTVEEITGVPESAVERTLAEGGQLAEVLREAMDEAGQAAAKDTLKHPAMQVINRILNAADTVPFKDAHLFKRELDEAIGTAWDQSVRKRVTNITKTLRGSLRQALSVHEPYNVATAAYADAVKLYTKGIAPRLRKLAVEDPEIVVRALRPGNPTQAQMLKDVLVNQAALVGDEQGGQAAWDAVRSAWARQHLIEGGLDKLGARLDKLAAGPARDFHQVMFGDGAGQQVWNNLRAIQAGYERAVQAGEAGVARATEAGRGGVAAARELGAQRVRDTRELGHQTMAAVRESRAQQIEAARGTVETARQAQRTGKAQSKAAEEAFGASRLAPLAKPGGARQAVGDALRAMALGPQRIWGAVSIARLMAGPTAGELVHWAAMSPQGTQQLVWALTSNRPAEAVVQLARASGVLGETVDFALGHEPAGQEGQPGQPPPKPRPKVGAPPPKPGELVAGPPQP